MHFAKHMGGVHLGSRMTSALARGSMGASALTRCAAERGMNPSPSRWQVGGGGRIRSGSCRNCGAGN
uniref:Uncharacterized protein n=1 Tax=Arundo donax TaxID=35708 RepID=A0A0A9DR59_ARUDO